MDKTISDVVRRKLRRMPKLKPSFFNVGPEFPLTPVGRARPKEDAKAEVQPLDPATKPVPYRVPDPSPPIASREEGVILARLFTDHRDFVRRTVERHGVPVRDTDDVTQEVFAIALRRIRDYDAATSARPWLFVIAIQRAANYRRLARNRLEPVPATPPPEPASHHADVESNMVDSEERLLVRELIGRLSPKLRTILIQHDLEERPMADIVAELEIPLKTGYARLKLAREEVCRRGQALAASLHFDTAARPLRNPHLLRMREMLLDYGQHKKKRKKKAGPRMGPTEPLTYLVFG